MHVLITCKNEEDPIKNEGAKVFSRFLSFCQFVLKILSKNRIMTSIKGSNSVANFRKTKIFKTNIDIVNDNVYTKFGFNLLILS